MAHMMGLPLMGLPSYLRSGIYDDMVINGDMMIFMVIYGD